MTPNILEALLSGNKPREMSGPDVPSLNSPSPPMLEHKDFLKGLLSNFMFSLGQGLTASSQAPEGSKFGAGLGGALQAPEILRARQLQEEQQRQQMAIQAQQAQAQQAYRQLQEENIRSQIADRARPSAVPIESLEMQDWMQKNPGNGPSDYLQWKTGLGKTVPESSFEKQTYEEWMSANPGGTRLQFIKERSAGTPSVDQQSMQDWLAKNPGKGASDYIAWRAKQSGTPSMISDIKSAAIEIANDIESGLQPPTTTGLYRYGGEVRAELGRRDFNLAKAQTEWSGVQKWMAGANSTQQLRLRQAVEKIEPHVDVISDLYAQLQGKQLPTGYRLWNKAALNVAKNLPGETGALAQNLETQIVDLSAELGNIYMGGNTPTDHALQQAAKNLNAEWNPQTFKMAVDLIKKNVVLRRNAIRFTGPAGVPTSTPYYPQEVEGTKKKDPLGIR